MSGEKRAEALAKACALMAERWGKELNQKLEAQRRHEADLRETEHAIEKMSAILPQSTCSALRRIAKLERMIAAEAEEIAGLRQNVVKWTARRNMLADRAAAMADAAERRQFEEEIFEGLGRRKSEASS